MIAGTSYDDDGGRSDDDGGSSEAGAPSTVWIPAQGMAPMNGNERNLDETVMKHNLHNPRYLSLTHDKLKLATLNDTSAKLLTPHHLPMSKSYFFLLFSTSL